jgi:hypothetical protein
MVDVMQDYARAWLDNDNHAVTMAASYVYRGWLTAAAAIGGNRGAAIVAAAEKYISDWLAAYDHANSNEAAFVYKAWLEAAEGPRLRRFFSEILNWIFVCDDSEIASFVLESWLAKDLEFEPVAEAVFNVIRRLYKSPSGAFLLKYVLRRGNVPDDIIFAALCWCARHPKHGDAVARLGSLSQRDGPFDDSQFVQVAAWVLYHQDSDIPSFVPFRKMLARALLVSLFIRGRQYPRAEKLARIYFVRWLRNGNIFRESGERGLDQRIEIVEALLTLLTHKEFSPALDECDRVALEQFCDWVGQWDRMNLFHVRELIPELCAISGPHSLWTRMLPSEQ